MEEWGVREGIQGVTVKAKGHLRAQWKSSRVEAWWIIYKYEGDLNGIDKESEHQVDSAHDQMKPTVLGMGYI